MHDCCDIIETAETGADKEMLQDQKKRREWLIQSLLNENRIYADIEIPGEDAEQKELLRTLMNVRPAAPISEAFECMQNDYLREEIRMDGVAGIEDMEEIREGIFLWKGDITRVSADAIVNAANSGMTGCYRPNHKCIDNRIHTFAGIQLRNTCAAIMREQGHDEVPGGAKVTAAFNLPCRYIIHTVGPDTAGKPTAEDEETLRSCYRSCLEVCEAYAIGSIAFCCIATGVFGFPKERAAEIAVETVTQYVNEANYVPRIIFDVYTDEDMETYRALLSN